MQQSRLITTTQAAKLSGETVMTVHRKIQRGEYTATETQAPCGRGGKQYLVDITDMPAEAQLKYFAAIEGGRLGDADIVSYRERYGEAGIMALMTRYNAVLQCRVIESDGHGGITQRKAELAAQLGVTLKTLYRWRDGYAQRGLAGLMDKIEQSNKGKPKSMCMFAQDYIEAQVLNQRKRTNRAVYAKLKHLRDELGTQACRRCPHCENSIVRQELVLGGNTWGYDLCNQPGQGMLIPASVSSIDRYVRTIPADQLAYARNGPRYWEAHYMPKAQRVKPEKINECWFGDHHMFDLFVVDDDGHIVRPWMTAWSDAASGCIVGWSVSTNPNSDIVAESFVRAVPRKNSSPFYGLPAIVYIDNGKDYRSKRFEGDVEVEHALGRLNEKICNVALLKILGVGVIHAQPYKAWSKTIERIFGILESRYIRELPGWCGGDPDKRPEYMTRAYLEKQATQGKLLTLRQFDLLLREQIIPAYHAERFDQPLSPLEIYQQTEQARTDIPGWEVLALARDKKVVRKVSTQGISLSKQLYWDDVLRHKVGEEVTVCYSESDRITVTIIQGNHFLCEAAMKDRLRLVGEEKGKISQHMELQRRTRNEIKAEINRVHLAADMALRNVIHEAIDLSEIAPGTITTLEYRKAAKAKAAKRAELEEYAKRDKDSDESASNTVWNMFKSYYHPQSEA